MPLTAVTGPRVLRKTVRSPMTSSKCSPVVMWLQVRVMTRYSREARHTDTGQAPRSGQLSRLYAGLMAPSSAGPGAAGWHGACPAPGYYVAEASMMVSKKGVPLERLLDEIRGAVKVAP